MMLGLCNMWRSVAWIVFMVALSNARNLRILNSSSAVSVESLRSQLASLEGQLNRVLRLVSTPIKENCTVDMASYGYDDSTKHGYVRTSGGSSEEVYTPEQIDRNRGVTVFELDAKACTVLSRQRFDTYAYEHAGERMQLLETLESAELGTIVVGVTADTPESNSALRNVVGSFFTSYNMNLDGLELRDKFAFIMQKGYPNRTVFQRKVRYGDCLRMKVALRGPIVSAVSFIQV